MSEQRIALKHHPNLPVLYRDVGCILICSKADAGDFSLYTRQVYY